MIRRWLALPVVAVVLLNGVARGEKADDAADESKLPIKRIVMFSSGVGYYQHQGKVDGDATIDLKFRTDNINDLLKSMILEDRGDGQISTVTYGSRDPITKTLQTFSIDLTKNPTLGQLLEQIRGEEVDVEAPSHISGTILGVEHRKVPGGEKQVVDKDFLNLLTAGGLMQVEMDAISRIKLANAQLDGELRQALKVLASGHATDKKTVTLKFLGKGERDVRVGYIQESPVWKTSYRLVLDEKEKPFLQGWAIVENTTDTDWKDVRLSLVSGRPISFAMDLYSPLYASRPTVVPELFASLTPQSYDQDLSWHDRRGEPVATAAPASPPMQTPASDGRMAGGTAMARRKGGEFGGAGGFGGERAAGSGLINDSMARGGAANADYSKSISDFEVGMQKASVQAAAKGGEVGELFQYDIKDPVTLARLRSAMLPIINDSIDGEKVSIYNPAADAKHPLNGVRLTNTSKLHLMQGPVTVFDGGVYAGDSQMPDLSPGSKRLLSYAMDLDVEVAPTKNARPQRLVSARFDNGVFVTESKQSQIQSFTVKNSGKRAKNVLIEYPIYKDWKLVTPKEPTETTREFYRFAVKAKPNESTDLKVEQEQTVQQKIAVGSLNSEFIRIYLSAKEVSEPVKDALREVSKRKGELADLERKKQQLEQEITTITQEQDRIRQNMQQIAKNSELYNRYVKKFTDQEDQVEKHRDAIRELTGEIMKGQRALDEYLKGLKIS
jgi:hypothetical protein